MPIRKVADWAGLRAAFEAGGESQKALAERFGVSATTLARRVKAENWSRPPRLPVRKAAAPSSGGKTSAGKAGGLIRRLYRSIDRKLAQLEARMEQDDNISSADHERETRAIGQLIRNVEKITGLEAPGVPSRATAGKKQSERDQMSEDNDAERIRLELAERILRLRELKGGDG